MTHMELYVPNSFQITPFYEADVVISLERNSSFAERIQRYPFIYDILYQANQMDEEDKPWENIEQYIPYIFENWQNEKERIALFFKNRDRQAAAQPMIQNIANLIDAIFWMNGKPVDSINMISNDIQGLDIKPINSKERIEFLLDNPVHYHSYIQLSELYIETRKQFEKLLLMRK